MRLMTGATLLALTLLAPALPLTAAPGDPPVLEDCRIYAAPGYPGIKARCGSFDVHLDPGDPGSPVLALNVAVVPALTLDPEPDPLLPVAGGPGGASVNFYAGYRGAFEKVRRDRDILLLDQRGTGHSARLDCDFGEEALEGRLSTEETIEYTRSCLDSLPYDPRFFTTSVAVRDIEALREALGYPALNLYGISYGTRVVQHYARLFPERSRTVILDGVAPPQLPLGPEIAIEAQRALDAVFSRCAESADCRQAFPQIETTFETLNETLTSEPVDVRLAHPVTGRWQTLSFDALKLAGALRLMSYNPATVALIPLLIDEAGKGNFEPLAATFLSTAEELSDQLAIGMHNAVVCTEDVPYYGDLDDAVLQQTYIGPLMTDSLLAMCSVWPAGRMDANFHQPLDISRPVLLLSGSADPITPPRYGDLAAVDLGNALHLTGLNQGHGLAPQGCVPEIIGRFVADAAFDELDTDCMQRLFAMPFFLDYSGPAP